VGTGRRLKPLLIHVEMRVFLVARKIPSDNIGTGMDRGSEAAGAARVAEDCRAAAAKRNSILSRKCGRGIKKL
jgi:hypothetical protein